MSVSDFSNFTNRIRHIQDTYGVLVHLTQYHISASKDLRARNTGKSYCANFTRFGRIRLYHHNNYLDLEGAVNRLEAELRQGVGGSDKITSEAYSGEKYIPKRDNTLYCTSNPYWKYNSLIDVPESKEEEEAKYIIRDIHPQDKIYNNVKQAEDMIKHKTVIPHTDIKRCVVKVVKAFKKTTEVKECGI